MPDVSIPVTGLSVNDPEPGEYVEINFAQGAASSGGGLRPILLLGNMSTAGDATPDTAIYGPPSPFAPVSPLPFDTEQDCINRFGAGSELHRMWRRVRKVNTTTPLYAIAVTASSGVAATKTITVAVTATANGSARCWLGDEFVDASITKGDTVTAIGLAIQNAYNSRSDWPVTALATAGAVALTAKVKGPRGNWIRASVNIIGTGVGTTSDTVAPAYLTSGATADSNVAALATILDLRFYYIVSAAEDATQFGALVSQLGTAALPTAGKRQRAFAASIDTLANAVTIATGINSARAEYVWLQECDWTPAEIAANNAAIYALFEAGSPPRCNFSQFGFQDSDAALWNIRKPRSGHTPTRSDRVSALMNGITPIGVLSNGQTYIDKRITTRCLNGSNQDFRIRDAHKVTVCDFFADDLIAKDAAQFNGKLIGNNTVPGQRLPGPKVVTPFNRKTAITKLVDDYDQMDLLQNADQIKLAVLANREPGTSSRISARVPLQVIDILDQLSTQINQV